jgi:hypothetical protein
MLILYRLLANGRTRKMPFTPARWEEGIALPEVVCQEGNATGTPWWKAYPDSVAHVEGLRRVTLLNLVNSSGRGYRGGVRII